MATSGVGVRELPEAHTFDFIGSGQGPVRDFGTERALVEPLGPNTGNFRACRPSKVGLERSRADSFARGFSGRERKRLFIARSLLD